jgi:hypothetical protein
MTVSFSRWISQSISDLRDKNKPLLSRILRPIYYIYVAFFLSITKQRPWGTNIFERNWDTLIILDACRVDALREVEDEYGFLTVDDTITSVGSTSFEWMNHTFDSEHQGEIKQTAYVSGNGYTDRVLEDGGETGHAAMPFGPTEYDVVDPEDFGSLEKLWRAEFNDDSEWTLSGNAGSRVHPRYTTDRAIAAGRKKEAERLVVHYMYPHGPYPLADNSELFRPFDPDGSPLRSGSIAREVAWDEYIAHLRLVLDEVEELLENLDAEDVVITADHGEAFGEYGFYGHVIGCPLPCVRQVPWVRTSAVDHGNYKPCGPNPESANQTTSAEERLEHLGYL